jgi:CDP-diacylglycerol--serine O-phosphatidyltransferase
MFWQWMPAVIIVSYLLYGLVRPWISRKWQREIEEESPEELDDNGDGSDPAAKI